MSSDLPDVSRSVPTTRKAKAVTPNKVGIYGAGMLVSILLILAAFAPGAQAATVNDDVNPGCNPDYAVILRLYESYFGRAPDSGGANYWISEYATGRRSLANIKTFFAQSPEFVQTYGGMSNADFVDRVYHNVLDRSPDAGGFTYWLGQLNNGMTRPRFIEFIADSGEFRDSHPYVLSDFCNSSAIPGYTLTNPFPGTVHARSDDGNVNVAFMDPSTEGGLTVSPGTAHAVPGAYGGTVAVNGNWYNSPHVFFGYSISDGEVLGYENGDIRHAWIGADFSGGLRFGRTNGVTPIPSYVTEAVTGKLIVVNGARFDYSTTISDDPTMTSRLPRTAIGIHEDGYLVMIVVDGHTKGPGMTSSELADYGISIGVRNLVMLDGGGSSAMWIADQGIVNQPSDGTRAVRNQAIWTAGTNWVN